MVDDSVRDFPVPSARSINEEYFCESEPLYVDDTVSENEKVLSGKLAVKISRYVDGQLKPVFEYVRNYRSMYDTFHPFRQLQDGVWYDYALISPEYTRFAVVDLQKQEIVAVLPYPQITEKFFEGLSDKALQGWAAEYKIGDMLPDSGFCPVDFKVFDWNERFRGKDINQLRRKLSADEPDEYVYSDKDLYAFTGQWAVYSGCVWGDDNGFKIRYIDLSRIREGIVTEDERFGYVTLSAPLAHISYYSDSDSFYIPTLLVTNRITGLSDPVGANWDDN